MKAALPCLPFQKILLFPKNRLFPMNRKFRFPNLPKQPISPETAEKICFSSGNFLFQKADGTYFYGHKSTDRDRDINITGVYADLHYRDYAIIGTDGKIHLHIEELTYFGEAIDDNYTVVKDFIIELP